VKRNRDSPRTSEKLTRFRPPFQHRAEVSDALIDEILLIYDVNRNCGVPERAMFEALLCSAFVWAKVVKETRDREGEEDYAVRLSLRSLRAFLVKLARILHTVERQLASIVPPRFLENLRDAIAITEEEASRNE